MHVPALQPDEAAQGYVGRILALNGCDTQRLWSDPLFASHLARHPPTQRARPWLEALAGINGLSVDSFLRHHTLTPFFNAFTVDDSPTWSSEMHTRAIRPNSGTRGHFCLDCVREDYSFWGFSYWRRAHQLPGVAWCPKHGTGLWVCNGVESFNHAPGSRPGKLEPPNDGEVADATANPRIRLYAEICLMLLDGHRPISLDTMVTVLQARTKALGLKSRPGVPGRHISDLAIDMFAGPWQQSYFPDLSTKVCGQSSYLPSLDRTYSSRSVAYPAAAYALALATIFDTADEAMTAIRTEQLKGQQAANFPGIGLSALPTLPQGTAIASAWHLFLAGASVKDACEVSSIDRNEFEALLRSAVTTASDLSDSRTCDFLGAAHRPKSGVRLSANNCQPTAQSEIALTRSS